MMKIVSLKSISLEDMTFVVTTGRNITTLQNAIVKCGLLNPPCLVLCPGGEYYQIVCGYRRISVLKNLSWQETPARIITDPTTAREIFLISLLDNLSHRQLNPIEQAKAVVKLLQYYQIDTVLNVYLPMLGLPPTRKKIDHLHSLIGLEEAIQEAVITGKLTVATAVKLSGFEPGDRWSLFQVMTGLNLSSSKQAEIVENCWDTAKRDEISIKAVLNDSVLKRILKQDKLTVSQKGDRVRSWLKKRRFPRLSQRAEKFSRLSKKLQLPQGVALSPPPAFEGGLFRIQFEFESMENLQQKTALITDLNKSSVMAEILEGEY
jgi:ParB family chromosome partitioning protein